MKTWRTAVAAWAGAAAVVIAASAEGAPRVLLLPADGLGATIATAEDVKAKLSANGTFDAVDILNVQGPQNPTPTLAQLMQYDAVMVWTNNSFASGVEMGDLLANYVDEGRGVVLANFVTVSTTPNRYLDGRWLTGNYPVIVPQGGSTNTTSTLGTIDLPAHPIMAGVNSFTNNTSSRPNNLTFTPHGQRVAAYADGRTLVAVSTQFPKRVDLGFFPASSDTSSFRWASSTDGGKILANAMIYASRNLVPSGTCCRGTTCSVVNATCSAPAGVGAVMVQPACNAGGSATTPCCYADFNKDGSRNIDDIFVYLNAWFAPVSNPFTKIGGDGAVMASIDDLFVFVNVWFAGGCG